MSHESCDSNVTVSVTIQWISQRSTGVLLAKIVLDLDGFIREIGMRQKSFDLSAKFVW